MKYQLAIFDLDGTILNTLDDLCDSVNEILKNYNFPVHTKDEVRLMVGNGMPKLIERAIPAAVFADGGRENPVYKSVLKDFVEYYELHSSIKTCPYDGIIEVFSKLKEMGIKIAVNSNKLHDACVILCQKYFPGYIDFVCGGRFDKEPKPSVKGVEEIYSELGKLSAVYIGDSDVDIQTAKNAGIASIGCAWGFRGSEVLKNAGADYIAEAPLNILEFL